MPLNQFHLWGNGTRGNLLDIAWGGAELYREEAEEERQEGTEKQRWTQEIQLWSSLLFFIFNMSKAVAFVV